MFQLHVSIYVSIITIDTKGIILFYNYKLISRLGFTSVLLKVLLVFSKDELLAWHLGSCLYILV